MNHRRQHPAVPKISAVRPGAAVNIVLKADQPTGRTVSGVVRDVLTRGDHPRGIKVRLADGRVGRVQSMMACASSSAAAELSSSEDTTGGVIAGVVGEGMHSVTADGGDGDSNEQGGYWDSNHNNSSSSRGGRPPRRGGRRGGRGGSGSWSGGYKEAVGGEEEQGLPSRQIGLDAYVKETRPKGKAKRPAHPAVATEDEAQDPSPPAASVTCPVCGAFEGDEAAVSHHVAGHFE